MPKPFQGDHIEGTSQTGGLDPIEIPPMYSATPGAMMLYQKKMCHECLKYLYFYSLSYHILSSYIIVPDCICQSLGLSAGVLMLYPNSQL